MKKNTTWSESSETEWKWLNTSSLCVCLRLFCSSAIRICVFVNCNVWLDFDSSTSSWNWIRYSSDGRASVVCVCVAYVSMGTRCVTRNEIKMAPPVAEPRFSFFWMLLDSSLPLFRTQFVVQKMMWRPLIYHFLMRHLDHSRFTKITEWSINGRSQRFSSSDYE